MRFFTTIRIINTWKQPQLAVGVEFLTPGSVHTIPRCSARRNPRLRRPGASLWYRGIDKRQRCCNICDTISHAPCALFVCGAGKEQVAV